MKRTAAVLVFFAVTAVLLYASDEFWPEIFAEKLPPADSIYVSKSQRKLTLFAESKPIKSYTVSLGKNPVGRKCEEGDSKTPEGRYSLEYRNRNSKNYRALKVSYPDSADSENARKAGRKPGGDIMIHGVTDGLGIFGPIFCRVDWTSGCIAVDNVSMAEIWGSASVGTPITKDP